MKGFNERPKNSTAESACNAALKSHTLTCAWCIFTFYFIYIYIYMKSP